MAAPKGKKIVIVKKKKGHGHGHHGGSWKVAYADFVTAMMAFFLVMWILGMDDSMKAAIEGYFSNPVGYKKGYSSGSSPIAVGNSPGQVNQKSIKLVVRNYEQRRFDQVAEKIRERIAAAQASTAAGDSAGTLGGLAKSLKVEVVVTSQGLRIELIDANEGETFFATGSARMNRSAALALGLIAAELGRLTNPLILEGHTDSRPLARADGYSNWELSADRANAARRVLEASGVVPFRIVAVRGLADRQLRVPEDPYAPSNRRISILLPFTEPAEPGDTTSAAAVPAT